MKTINKETQSRLTPHQVLDLLKEGNNRFVNNLKINRNLLQQVNETKEGQYPLAVILSCIDSRTSTELIFDQGLGDIFSIRIAGNVLNDDVLGSMEFACKKAGAKIAIVMGHTRCGAIEGAIKGLEMGYVTQLLKKLQPSVKKALTMRPSTQTNEHDLSDIVARNNVLLTMEQIQQRSDILSEMSDGGEIVIVGAIYNVESGLVSFFDVTGQQIGGRQMANGTTGF